MNTENIISLSAVLSKIGFDNLSYDLLQRICCKPISFVLSQKIRRDLDRLQYDFYFQRHTNGYELIYYEATLMRELQLSDVIINQVAVKKLEQKMASIVWDPLPAENPFRLHDETTWQREKTIEEVVNELARLSATVDGKSYADALRARFWSGTLMEQLMGSLAPIRSKMEVSQRFYPIAGEFISGEEAFRFLQNRWQERLMQIRRKVTASTLEDSSNANDEKKKRKNGRGRKIS